LDTNVLVSASATRGLCTDLFRHVLAEHDLITGEAVLAELRRVLRDRIKVPGPTTTAIEQWLRDHVIVPKPSEPHPLPVRDFDGRWVLASAVAGNADVLVTGDSDLLEVAPGAPLPFLDPRSFWRLVTKTSGTER
jgi:putative PIN family toxin of toxin-antitoxin system